jgi:pimeloyl-ACP methyl ester carboxylesterase
VPTVERSRLIAPIAFVAIVVLVAACSSSGATGWTFAPTTSGPAPAASGGSSAAPSAPASQAPASGKPAASGPIASGSPAASGSAAPSGSTASWSLVEKTPCLTTFECVTLAVPKDHFAAGGSPTWNITFAVHRATKDRKGTYVEITGGPGSADIPDSDSYLDYYATSITESYDMVYMDQRGIGRSGPIQCTKAAAAYYVSAARPQIPAERADAAAAAQTFAKDCIAEAGVAEADLPFYATSQAVEDLEAVRDYLGVDKMDLYGLSYGTQFVQTYAAAHPDRIATLYVDGPVDLTIDGPTYYVEAARSAEDTLIATLAACTADETCVADVAGGDALAAYDALATKLDTGPITFDFPISDGTTVPRTLTNADLENAAFNALYYSYDRLLLQRAVAAASHEDYVPLAKLGYNAVGLDPDTLVAEVDPGYSDAMYYAVECQDYAFYPDAGDPDARLTAWIDGAAAAGINDTRLETGYYGDLPCLYWPTARATSERPAPIVDPPYPVFVLTSTTDPATPIANGMRIYSRLKDAYFFQAVGGPHVIYAWGESCPDDQMTAWLVDRTPPSTRVTTCIWDLADPYAAIAPSSASAYKDALALAKSVDDQIFNTYDFIYFEGESVTAGCDHGGSITYASSETGTEVRLHACEFTGDLPLTGKGETDDEAGTFELDVTSGDDKLHYERDGEGATSVTGTFDGRKVDQEGAA